VQKINGFRTINKNKMNKKEQVLAILENEVEELYYKVNGIDEDKLPVIAESIVNLLDLCDVSISEAEVCRHCGSKAVIDFGIAKKCSDCREII
jgi:translation elongation factor EF-Tu-like GTPase